MDGRTEGWIDRHIILPLRGFEPMACGRMRYAQLRAAQIIIKKKRGQPNREKERQRDRYNDI